jgi:hypothetical protein
LDGESVLDEGVGGSPWEYVAVSMDIEEIVTESTEMVILVEMGYSCSWERYTPDVIM